MSDIRTWLEAIGLAQYADAFEANDIDMDLLGQVDDQMLKDFGVASGGHRLRIRNAVAKLAQASAADTKADSVGIPTGTNAASAERRQLTVMFCDLVGSTALSAKLDPEDLRSIIGSCHRCCAEVITKSGGFVAKYMGDGVLAYFGYPQAHEEDAERAVRAGLALVEAVGRLDGHAGTALQVRIGIATGLVVVGDLLGEGAAQEQAVVGETPNLAARLQALAEPGAVVIASSTRKLTKALFEYGDLGRVALKGFAEDVPAWRVLGLGSAEGRFEALRTATTPLVGRAEETELLLRRWEQVQRGEGQVVLIAGEPGIGKSRIAQTIVERISTEPHTRLRYFCSPHHQDSALHPSIAQLERAAGFRREDTPEQRLAKLEAVLAQSTNDLRETVPLLADLLSIPAGHHYPQLNLTPQKRKERTLRAQLTQVEGLAARQPVLMVWEDVHWSDPTTRESLDLLVDRATTLRVLVIITFRPEFAPPWVGRPHVTLLTLSRLPPRQRAEIITHVTAGKTLPKEIADQIVDRTDGVPLFIEELTKSVLESGLVADVGDRYAAAAPVASLAIPTSLHASLLSRLDRLAPTREIAQSAAALGRSFSHELISAVAQMPQKQIDDALAQLTTAELIFRRGTPPDAEYTFKHALVQDAAYSTLLRSRRQQLHARIATTLERQFPDIVAGQPEVVARHCTEAGLSDAAIDWWRKAGELTLRRSAFGEAVAHFEKAIGLADTLADTPAHRLRRLRLQTTHAQALVHARGQSAPETNAAFARARELAAGVEEPAERFPTYYGLWTGAYNRVDLASMRELAQLFLQDAERWPESSEAGIAHRICGITRWFEGDYRRALPHLEQAVANYDHERDRHMVVGYAWDPGIPAMAYLALVTWALGAVERGLAHMGELLSVAARGGHIPTLAYANLVAALFEAIRRNPDQARPYAETLVGLARDHVLPQFLAYGTFLLGWARWGGGQADGEPQMREGLALLKEMGIRPQLPFWGILLAELEATSGRLADSFVTLNAQLALIEQTGQHTFDADVHWVRGELLLKRDPPVAAEAEQAFMRSIQIAGNQQTRIYELRAATSLARLWRDQGKRDEARDLLAPVYNWFTEGFDTLDLKQAKALLEQLSA